MKKKKLFWNRVPGTGPSADRAPDWVQILGPGSNRIWDQFQNLGTSSNQVRSRFLKFQLSTRSYSPLDQRQDTRSKQKIS